MKELELEELTRNDSKYKKININGEHVVEIDPTKFLPKSEPKKEDNSPKMIEVIGEQLFNAVERKKYEFAMRRKAIKEAIAEKKLNDEINSELTEDELIEKEMMHDNIKDNKVDTSNNDFNQPKPIYKIASNKYY